MYAYYLSKGHTLDSLLSLNHLEKIMYAESMLFILEEEKKRLPGLTGK